MTNNTNAVVWTKHVLFHYGPFIAILSLPTAQGAAYRFEVVAKEKLKSLPSAKLVLNASHTNPSGEGSLVLGLEGNASPGGNRGNK